MTLPARRRGRITLAISIAAALFAGTLQAQEPSTSVTPAKSAAPAATPKGSKAPAKSGAAESAGDQKSAESYSLGVMWGEELRSAGVAPDAVNAARIAQGVQDAVSGKVKVSDQDRLNIRALATSAGDANHRAAVKFLADNGKKPGVVTTASGLQYQELRAGSGNPPKTGDSVTVNYRGTLIDGTEFDGTDKHGGQPATFEVGHVIPGWNEALVLMKPGAKWKLFIPPQLAYDLRPPPGIAPGSLLLFDVELLSVKPAPPPAASAPATPPVGKSPPQPPPK